MQSDVREIVVVVLLALIGVLLAALVVLAPWDLAQATQVPVKEFVSHPPGRP